MRPSAQHSSSVRAHGGDAALLHDEVMTFLSAMSCVFLHLFPGALGIGSL